MKYVATCPEGQATRKSDRRYTHAVLWVRDGKVTNANWCGSYALAIKKEASERRDGWASRIVEAVPAGVKGGLPIWTSNISDS